MTMSAEELSAQLFRSTIGALEMNSVYLGDQLGYYRAMADGTAITAGELAARTGTAARYTAEWLEHQAVRGLISVVGTGGDAWERRYRLPAEHVPVLADADSVLFGAQTAVQLARYGRRLPDVVRAYRTGEAPPPLPWEPEGRVDTNRALFQQLLGRQWLPSLTELDSRLRARPAARVADIACGMGWSSIAMASAYPLITVDGIDLDDRGIETARANARRSGVADRVRFEVADAAEFRPSRRYDLVTVIEALHDMARPVDALRAARELLTGDGWVMVVDVRAEEEFTVPGTEREQCDYGWSLIACLPDAMGTPDTAATGTVMRPKTLRAYAEAAGFAKVEVLPVDTPYWRFYRLSPG
ncbi:SAM-dependent methyltransferase [Streptomyces sp. MMS24-I2-30]|uniref:SAM-dependent methyltransferase n=1 Tax=Streptomyces sp. MMS24-I2-30 TaxID=3351564 RepID=UPI003896B522